MNLDLINGGVGIVGTLFILRSIVLLYKHKQVRGIFWPIAIFFSGASTWSGYFFYELQMVYSFWANVCYAVANLTWLMLAVKYRRN